jgi:hypothetical protein
MFGKEIDCEWNDAAGVFEGGGADWGCDLSDWFG